MKVFGIKKMVTRSRHAFLGGFDLGIGIDIYLPQCTRCASSTLLKSGLQKLPGRVFAALSPVRLTCSRYMLHKTSSSHQAF